MNSYEHNQKIRAYRADQASRLTPLDIVKIQFGSRGGTQAAIFIRRTRGGKFELDKLNYASGTFTPRTCTGEIIIGKLSPVDERFDICRARRARYSDQRRTLPSTSKDGTHPMTKYDLEFEQSDGETTIKACTPDGCVFVYTLPTDLLAAICERGTLESKR